MFREKSFILFNVFLLISPLLLFFGTACRSAEKLEKAEKTGELETVNPAKMPEAGRWNKNYLALTDAKPEFTLSAADLYKEYKTDKNAVEKYKNKITAVTGDFDRMDPEKSEVGGYRVQLKAGGLFEWIICEVDEEEKDQFSNLPKNRFLKIQGIGEDLWLGGPTFKHCALVDPPAR